MAGKWEEECIRFGDHAASAKGIASMMHDPADAEAIERFYRLGCRIAEFPMHEPAARRAAAMTMPVVMGCPNVLRGKSLKGLASATDLVVKGLCDVLTSDYYYPLMIAAMRKLAPSKAEGRSDVEALAGVWPLVSQNPARATGLEDRGSILPGLRADLLLMRDQPPFDMVAVFVAGELKLLRDSTLI